MNGLRDSASFPNTTGVELGLGKRRPEAPTMIERLGPLTGALT